MPRANGKLDQGRPRAAAYVALAFRPAAFPLHAELRPPPAAVTLGKLVSVGVRRREFRHRICIVQRFFGGRSFSSVITTRATARLLSRCFTRAMYSPSPFTNSRFGPRTGMPVRCRDSGRVHRTPQTGARSFRAMPEHDLRVTNHCQGGGTVNRPRAHVSYRKQTTEHMQGRNFPVHFLFPIFRQNPIAPALRSLRGRSSSSVIKNRGEAKRISRWFIRATHLSSTTHQSPLTNHRHLPGVPETLGVLGWLPGTVTRVETLPSSTKQTTAYPSTRNVPAHTNFRRIFALRCHNRVAKLLQTLDPAAARFCVTMVLEVSGETA